MIFVGAPPASRVVLDVVQSALRFTQSKADPAVTRHSDKSMEDYFKGLKKGDIVALRIHEADKASFLP